MAVPISVVVIAENEPTDFVTGNVELRKLRPEYYMWISPTTGNTKRWNPNTESWEVIPVKSHVANHEKDGSDPISKLGTIHFQGSVYAGASNNDLGITREIALAEGTLSVKKGIIVGWTPVIPP